MKQRFELSLHSIFLAYLSKSLVGFVIELSIYLYLLLSCIYLTEILNASQNPSIYHQRRTYYMQPHSMSCSISTWVQASFTIAPATKQLTNLLNQCSAGFCLLCSPFSSASPASNTFRLLVFFCGNRILKSIESRNIGMNGNPSSPPMLRLIERNLLISIQKPEESILDQQPNTYIVIKPFSKISLSLYSPCNFMFYINSQEQMYLLTVYVNKDVSSLQILDWERLLLE